jgi:SAM-dependent methyltransferase
MTDADRYIQRLADESLAVDDPTGWFEPVYLAAAGGALTLPWDRRVPQPMLVEWVGSRGGLDGAGRRAVVVGCGLGADAEYVAGLGYTTTAFDVSPTAVATARDRFPGSPVRYTTADLLDPPAAWHKGFDLAVECFTVQAMAPAAHGRAIANVAGLVAAGGTLIVVASGREPGYAAAPAPPWPLTREEIEAFATGGLSTVRVELLPHPERSDIIRWRAEFRRS